MNSDKFHTEHLSSSELPNISADDIQNFFQSKVFKKVLVPLTDTTRPIFKALILHGLAVANKSLSYIDKNINRTLLIEGAMLHDIGCIFTYAPKIDCFGTNPYLAHGFLGAEILKENNFPLLAEIARNHIGSGLTKSEVKKLSLPIPEQDYQPLTKEEILIAWADKFFSKGTLKPERLLQEKPLPLVIKSLRKHGDQKAERFIQWHEKISAGTL